MENDNCSAPHLMMQETILAPGQEWCPQLPGWLMVHVRSGVGYCLEKQLNTDLPTGAAVLVSQEVDVNLYASQLGGMNLLYFRVAPELLTGVITVGEQSFFEDAAARRELSHQVLPPAHPVAVKFKELCADRQRRDFAFRLQMLDLFAQLFGELMTAGTGADTPAPRDARERLRQFLDQSLASDWLNLSFTQLVREINCTPRHLSRLFRELTGMSFREQQAKIRLSRASELLVSTESKVVDVALDSGFQSLNLFNLMFRRRFGLSPGRWRKESHGKKTIHRKTVVVGLQS
jgi:AraC-like DNA-binding protein